MNVAQPRIPRPKGARKIPASELDPIRRTSRDGQGPVVRHGTFRSFDGTRIFYSVEGSGKPLVFCYGLVCSSLHWTYQIDHFRNRYQAIWFDYRAHHNSDVPADLGSITVPNFATDLGLLLDELEIERAVIAGHSMGVNVALELYRQRPERVQALILSNGTPRHPLETMFHGNAAQTGLRALARLYRSSPKIFTRLWRMQKQNPLTHLIVTLGGFNPHLTAPADVELYVRQVIDMDPAIFFQLLEDYDQFDATPWLHQVRVPTLILSGEKDHMTPVKEQELLNQLIPGSRLEIVPRGSHCIQMDDPPLINEKITRFLNELAY